MAFRLHDPRPQFTDATGAPVAGGTVYFYDTGTTTPKNVYGERALSTNNGSSLVLGADGRTQVDCWLSGVYRVNLKDSGGVQIAGYPMDDVRDLDSAGAVTVPDPATGTDGQVVMTNGATYSLEDIETLPDNTGQGGKILRTDGALNYWGAETAQTTYDADSLPGSFEQTNSATGGFVFGNIRVQWGVATCPTAASVVSSVAVTFATAFASAPYGVQVTPSVGGVTSDTPSGRCSAQALSASASGFTASVFAGAENNGGNANITSAVTVYWFAYGPK